MKATICTYESTHLIALAGSLLLLSRDRIIPQRGAFVYFFLSKIDVLYLV